MQDNRRKSKALIFETKGFGELSSRIKFRQYLEHGRRIHDVSSMCCVLWRVSFGKHMAISCYSFRRRNQQFYLQKMNDWSIVSSNILLIIAGASKADRWLHNNVRARRPAGMVSRIGRNTSLHRGWWFFSQRLNLHECKLWFFHFNKMSLVSVFYGPDYFGPRREWMQWPVFFSVHIGAEYQRAFVCSGLADFIQQFARVWKAARVH